LLKNKGIVY